MDDGAKLGSGLKLCTNSFTYDDCLKICQILDTNFGLKASVQKTGALDQYNVYIWKQSMEDLRDIVLPFMEPSMKYKLL